MNLKSLFILIICCIALTVSYAQPCNLIPSATYASPVCKNRNLSLYGSSAVSGVSYNWSGPMGFTSTLQNPTPAAPPFSAGPYTYTLRVSKAGCTSETTSVTLYVQSTPDTPLLHIQDLPVCIGDTFIIYEVAHLGFQDTLKVWGKTPGNPGMFGKTSFPNFTINDTGYYYATITSRAGCISDTSHVYISDTMVTSSKSPKPSVIIQTIGSLGPVTMLPAYRLVNLVATVSDAGNNPKYQWRKNSVNIPGATSRTYSAISYQDFNINDTFTCQVTRFPRCIESIISAPIITQLGVAVERVHASDYYNILPNPSNGNFTIHGIFIRGQRLSLDVINTLGQSILKKEIIVDNTHGFPINLPDLNSGIYYLKLQSGQSSECIRFVIDR